MAERIHVAIIGGGQAGLATSHELTRLGVEHVILERSRVGQSWRDRWDSFCLVTPNWSVQLPGHRYRDNDPDGYMHRDEIVDYLEGYAASFGAPVREEVEVTKLELADAGWTLQTSNGEVQARAVVVATGAFQRAHRPSAWESLPSSLLQIDVEDYRNPGALPAGRVLVIGSGQSGCQIAEDLVQGGREVVLACGRAPWLPRRVGQRDIFWWLTESGFMDVPLAALPTPAERLTANPQLTGSHGGHDLNFRTLRAQGVTLVGHFRGARDHVAQFAPDLSESVAFGDQAFREFGGLIRGLAGDLGLSLDDLEEPAPFEAKGPETVDLVGFGAVIFAGGFRPEYGSWVQAPGAFDALGFPIQSDDGRGIMPGLHFVGVHFLRKRKSSLLAGVGEDASVVVRQIVSA